MNKYEFYPEIEVENPYERPRFFLEFHTWDGVKWTYKICQRVFILPEEDYQKALEERGDDVSLLMGVEGHPYTLFEGELNKNENAISLDTQSFLMYLVDALNEKVENDNIQKIADAWEKQRSSK